MKRFLILLLASFIGVVANCQTTNFEEQWYKFYGDRQVRLVSADVSLDHVVVTIEVEALKPIKRLTIFHTKNTFLETNFMRLPLRGQLDSDGKLHNADIGRGWDKVAKGETRRYKLYFEGHFPSAVSWIKLADEGVNGRHGYCLPEHKITIGRNAAHFESFSTSDKIREHIDKHNDGICGIYEIVGSDSVVMACILGTNSEGEENYYLIYESCRFGSSYAFLWEVGDTVAKLRKTASDIFWTDDWRDASHCNKISGGVTFDGVSMKCALNNGEKMAFIKTYPYSFGSSGSQKGNEWTGTGFALNNGYVVTNNHVVEGATSISVVGVNGKNMELKAEVVSVDTHNDLALIRITDSRFTGFGSIPYSVKNSLASVGSDVFVLGYPMTYYMGEEIKLTNGIISSNSGYKGDITTYQISAPVQPGNSGGPLFDKDGNIIGIVNAGMPDADNVGYAIKTTYLYSLVSNSVSGSVMPSNNSVAGKSLPDKVKVLRNYVFFIKCH